MKKVGILTLCGLVAAMLLGLAGSADARPNYPKVLDKVEGFKKIESEAAEAKCNVCHYGKTKKNRNDFGKALIKGGLKKDAYDEVQKDLDKLGKLLNDHVDKLLKSEDGKAFKERIEAGKLPAENPEEDE